MVSVSIPFNSGVSILSNMYLVVFNSSFKSDSHFPYIFPIHRCNNCGLFLVLFLLPSDLSASSCTTTLPLCAHYILGKDFYAVLSPCGIY